MLFRSRKFKVTIEELGKRGRKAKPKEEPAPAPKKRGRPKKVIKNEDS